MENGKKFVYATYFKIIVRKSVVTNLRLSVNLVKKLFALLLF